MVVGPLDDVKLQEITGTGVVEFLKKDEVWESEDEGRSSGREFKYVVPREYFCINRIGSSKTGKRTSVPKPDLQHRSVGTFYPWFFSVIDSKTG